MIATAAARAVRSIRNDRVTASSVEVRGNETIRDGFESDSGSAQSAETAVVDASTGRFYELTARQLTAIHLLTMGKSVVATAKSLEIGVSTLHRWKSKQPAFIAELNRRKSELFEHTIDKLRSTMAKAVGELAKQMDSVNPTKRLEAAKYLLPMLQPRKWIVPTGPSDAEGVIDEQIRERRATNGEEPTAEITADERAEAIAEAEAAVGQVPSNRRHPERSEGSGSSPKPNASSQLDTRESQVLRCAQDDGARKNDGTENAASSDVGAAQLGAPAFAAPRLSPADSLVSQLYSPRDRRSHNMP